MLSENIKRLVQYGIDAGLTPECERIYTTNLLLELFHEDDYEEVEVNGEKELEEILGELLDEACSRGIIENSVVYRDLFDTKMMNCLMPRPAQVQETFWKKYEESPEAATDYYYKLSQDSDYIRRYRVKKDWKWTVDSPYGEIDITINLSKPEKDPKAIAAAKMRKQAVIQNVCSVWKMKDMQEESIIRQGKIIESCRSQSMTVHGDSSILHTYTTTNTVSYLMENTHR